MLDFNRNIMKKIFVATLVIIACLCGCTKTMEESCSTKVAQAEFEIGLPIEISRTAMDNEGKASWAEGDSFTLWAKNRTGGYNINGANFKLYYFWHSFASAVFISSTNVLTEGNYTYYAVSPTPQTVNGRKASYTLPSEQRGDVLDGNSDVLVATPIESAALSTEKVNNLALDFNHKTHLFKLVIPQNGNPLNNPISKVVFTFPTAVTGDFTIDATTPDAVPTISGGSKLLVVNIPEGLDVGEVAWGRIIETSISGNVSYYAVSTIGERTLDRTFKLSKECKGGHITPLSLRIPDPIPPTVLRFKVGKNNLGEAVQKVSIVDHNGKVLKSFANNSNNIYDLEQHGIYEEGVFQTYTGRTFTIRFESEHAIVEKKITIPSTLTKYEVNTVATIDVPYLFYEDFTSIHTSFEKDDARVDNLMSANGMLLDNYMSVSGWNGAHIKGVAGKSVRVNTRHQSFAGATRSNGRLDSPSMKALKSGANVTLKVEFDMGAYANSGYSKNNDIFCIAGMHTQPESSALNGLTATTVAGTDINDDKRVPGIFSSVCLQTSYISQNCNNDSFGATLPTYSFTAYGCTSATRFGWAPCCIQQNWGSGNAHYYIYIDNIRVSIAQ